MGVGASAALAAGATIPRNGTWAGREGAVACVEGADCGPFDQQAYMVIRNRVPSQFTYDMVLRCVSPEDGRQFDVAFRGKGAPGGRAIPASGISRASRAVPDAGLSGRTVDATVILDFARRGRPQLRVTASRATPQERCSGRADIPLRWGPLPPRPR